MTNPIYIPDCVFIAFDRVEKFIKPTAALAPDFLQSRTVFYDVQSANCVRNNTQPGRLYAALSYRLLHISCRTRRAIKSFYDCRAACRIFFPPICSASPDLIVTHDLSRRSFSLSCLVLFTYGKSPRPDKLR